MAKRTYKYEITGTVTVDEAEATDEYLRRMNRFAPEHDDPERQAEQMAQMASTPTESLVARWLGEAVWSAIPGAMPPGSSCPQANVQIWDVERD